MPKSWSDEAIILRTYNVGETDRFCLLFTKHHGRIAARANGVRRLSSRRGAGLLPLHRISVVCELHSFGLTVASAVCLDAHASSWSTPLSFSCAEQGIELLLQLTDEGVPMQTVYDLTDEFIDACGLPNAASFPPLFHLRLLSMLGLCPSLTHSCIDHHCFREGEDIVFSSRHGGLVRRSDDASGMRLSPAFLGFLRTQEAKTLRECSAMPDTLFSELSRFVQGLLGSQLGSSLKSSAVCLAMSA